MGLKAVKKCQKKGRGGERGGIIEKHSHFNKLGVYLLSYP
jgi:hypothetical protein